MSTRAIRGLTTSPNNQITGAALFSQVELDWQLGGGFAVDSPSGSIVAQLVQAMAGFGGSRSAADGLKCCPSRYLHIAVDVADAAAATWAVIELLKSREDECGKSANTKLLAAETLGKSSIWPPSGHIFISKLCGEFARKTGGAWHSAYAMFGAIRLRTALSMSSCTTIP
jgi:hypothetical protein